MEIEQYSTQPTVSNLVCVKIIIIIIIIIIKSPLIRVRKLAFFDIAPLILLETKLNAITQ